jgi:hypothetical protein
MDSAASLHCTFDILDIADPVLLPEPLPIGSANGGIIYATHSGRSHLSPLILVHDVPESMPRQGFTYSIGPHRAMTVLDSSDKHLCTCTGHMLIRSSPFIPINWARPIWAQISILFRPISFGLTDSAHPISALGFCYPT